MMLVKRPDIRTDIISDAEYEYNCAHYEWAFYTPPERFMFHHYDEPPENIMVCHRPMIGMERYCVEKLEGGFCGIYDTREVSKYIKTKTWIVIDDNGYFIKSDIAELKNKLSEKELELKSLEKGGA